MIILRFSLRLKGSCHNDLNELMSAGLPLAKKIYRLTGYKPNPHSAHI